MLLASIHFLVFALVAAVGAGVVTARFRSRRVGWITGVTVLLAFAGLYAALYFLVLAPVAARG